MASNYMHWLSDDEEILQDLQRRVVLIGLTGSGKSSTANTIIGRREFVSSASGSSVTKKCKRVEEDIHGYKLSIVDTPGLFDTEMTYQEVTTEMTKCIHMLCPGPHAFILVIKIGRFTAELEQTVSHFVENFGEKMFRHMLVIFTRKDDIDRDGVAIETLLENVPKFLKDVLDKCGNRFLAFDNKTDSVTKEKNVQDLFNLVDDILVKNKGHCYTNKMFKEAERELKRKERKAKEEMQRKKQEEIDIQTEKIRREKQIEVDRELAERVYHDEVMKMEERKQSYRERELRKIERKIQAVQSEMDRGQYSSSRSKISDLRSELHRLRRKHKRMDEEERLNTTLERSRSILVHT